MAIEFTCPCGARYTVDDSKLGILFHCDACGLDIPVKATPPAAAPAPVVPPPPEGEAKSPAADVKPPEGEAKAEGPLPVAEIVEDTPAAKPGAKVSLSALAAGMGREKKGTADLIAQLGGGPRPAGAPGAAPASGAPGVGPGAAAPKAAGAKKPAAARPTTRHQRAAHHLGFKRYVWLPALGVGILCVLMGVGAIGCYSMSHGTTVSVTEILAAGAGGKITQDDKGNDIFEDNRGEVRMRVFKDDSGEAWLIDPDATDVKVVGGKVVGLISGFDVAGTRATANADYCNTIGATAYVAKEETKVHGRRTILLVFAAAFLLVGLSLIVLALWMRHDVKLVQAKEKAEEAEEAVANPPAAPAPAAPTVAVSPAAAPAPEVVPAAAAPAPAVAPTAPSAAPTAPAEAPPATPAGN